MPNRSEPNLVVVDIETTGVNPFKHDALAVAFVPLDRSLPECEVFISHAGTEWNAFALKNFERFRDDWAARAIPAPQACGFIESYIEETFAGEQVTLVGHNVGFDVAFLRKIAHYGNRDQLRGISHRAIDTHTLLYVLTLAQKIPASATTSDGAFRYFGIDVPIGIRHTAIHDARATRTLFLRLLDALGTRDSTLSPLHAFAASRL